MLDGSVTCASVPNQPRGPKMPRAAVDPPRGYGRELITRSLNQCRQVYDVAMVSHAPYKSGHKRPGGK
jgi:hypothetical protein